MPTLPYSTPDLQEVRTRNDHARRIVAGFASALPALTDIWRDIDGALDDTAALSAEITRLSAELHDARLDRANLLAAMRAAHADGEPDPMRYLRDELDAPEMPSAASRGPA
jgi:hypothetical protein